MSTKIYELSIMVSSFWTSWYIISVDQVSDAIDSSELAMGVWDTMNFMDGR